MGIVPRKYSESAPTELDVLFNGDDGPRRDAAWESLVAKHTRLLMAVSRRLGGDHDSVMERYSYILEKLRESDYRRLRGFHAGTGATFTTWLTVAARNLTLDLHRHKFGRVRRERCDDRNSLLHAARLALNDLTEGDTPPELIEDPRGVPPDSVTIQSEIESCLQNALAGLSSTDRLLLTLRFEDDLSAARIAQIVGYATPFHVYRRLNTILDALRSALHARGIDSPEG